VGDAFDLIVLGAGTGGYAAALRGATLGLSVALVEREKVGGTCLHWGCIPTKALLHSAEVLDTINEASHFGVAADNPRFDWDGVQQYKEGVVGKMFKGLEGLIKARKIEVVRGEGAMRSPTTVAVGDRQLTGRNVVIATGSAPKMIPTLTPGPRVITSNEALSMGVPRSAIVLGGGSVGSEFASLWNSFGSKVTLVEMLPTLVPLEDPDCGKELAKQFTKRGISVMTGAKVEDVNVSDDRVTATIATNGKTQTVEAEVILVATGRRPVTEGAALDAAGVQLDDRGFVTIKDGFETAASGVFAVGDVIATPGLAHVSFAEGMYVAELLAGLNPRPIDYNAIARVTYSAPEVAAVGLTEAQAREKGADVVTKSVNFNHIGRAVILGASGFCKIVADKSGAVLGTHFVGPRVSELVAEAILAVGWEAMPEEVSQFIHPHPSMSEAFGEATLAMAGRPLHTA